MSENEDESKGWMPLWLAVLWLPSAACLLVAAILGLVYLIGLWTIPTTIIGLLAFKLAHAGFEIAVDEGWLKED